MVNAFIAAESGDKYFTMTVAVARSAVAASAVVGSAVTGNEEEAKY